MKITTSSVQVGIAAIGLGAVGTALVTQHFFDMQPCPWCVLQRLIFVAIALVALIGLAWRSASGERVTTLGVIALGGTGIAAALWHYFVAASSASCNLTLADRIMKFTGLPGLLPEVFEARATCADAAVKLLGVPYVLWALALFIVLTASALWLLLRAANASAR
jgi:disulfide bond formation protein DsbB